MRYIRLVSVMIFTFLVLSLMPVHIAYAESDQEQKQDIYDSLQDSIRNNWKNGMESLETTEEIEIKGPLMERILRSIANVFYKNLMSIKAWSLFIGLISLISGVFITVTAKLNKKLKRFAISLFVITIPVLLIVFVFGITKLVSMFI